MSESRPSQRGARSSDSTVARVDVSKMPRVLQRITARALHYPGRMALAIGCSLGAAVASLTLPRLFGQGVDQAGALLKAGAAHAGEAQGALVATALLVITATVIRGVLTMMTGYQAEYVSQRVGYDLSLEYFQQLQRLSFVSSPTPTWSTGSKSRRKSYSTFGSRWPPASSTTTVVCGPCVARSRASTP